MARVSRKEIAALRRRVEASPASARLRWLREDHERQVASVAAHNAMSDEEWRADRLDLPVAEILYAPMSREDVRAMVEAEIAGEERTFRTVTPPGVFLPRPEIDQDILDILNGEVSSPVGGFHGDAEEPR